jgi:hypothetical protein
VIVVQVSTLAAHALLTIINEINIHICIANRLERKAVPLKETTPSGPLI